MSNYSNNKNCTNTVVVQRLSPIFNYNPPQQNPKITDAKYKNYIDKTHLLKTDCL